MKCRLHLIVALLCTMVQGLWAWEGNGTSTDPYRVGSSADWKQLADDVAGGNSYSGKHFRMTADIDANGVSVGTESHPFSGTFDGYSYTLTYSRGGLKGEGTEWINDYCAPFVLVEGATILNLNTTGAIFSSHKFAAGFVSMIGGKGRTSLENCHTDCMLDAGSELKNDATFGGLVGVVNEDCQESPVIKNCSYAGSISFWATCSGGLVGYTVKTPVVFEHCLFAPKEIPYVSGCATLVRMAPGVECSFKQCYFTMKMGTPQGEAVFNSVYVADDCKYEMMSEATVNFNGTKYWQKGAVVRLTAPADAQFDHWVTEKSCYINDPWARDGTHVISDIVTRPSFSYVGSMPRAKLERTMDGTRYRYLASHDYFLYLSDEYCAQRGYYCNSSDWLVKKVGNTEVFVTAVVGWENGKIPGDGAQIHNDLSGDWRDYTLMACIAPHAFENCSELKTLYFKDTDANNYNAQTSFDFIIGDYAFAHCPNLTEIKMMQYTTAGDNHWEALRPEQVSSLPANVFEGSLRANFSCDVSQYQNFIGSATWKDVRNRIFVYSHTPKDMEVNGARYSEMRNTRGESLKNDSVGHEALMETLRLWNADYQQFVAGNLLSSSSKNVWYTQVVGCDESYLKSNSGVMRIYNDPGSYYNYKTIAIARNAFQGSRELKAIEFWQTNGRSENSFDDLKLVIQNGAFYDCPNLKELRMYYYVQDGSDHWEVLGPEDVIPGDNIFGLPSEEQLAKMTKKDIEAWPVENEDFRIVVSPSLYDEFINDPNWSKYSQYIVAAEYEPTDWSPIREEGLSYDYASKLANTASTDQVVISQLSWWNVPVKILEALTIVKTAYNLYTSNVFRNVLDIIKGYKGFLNNWSGMQGAVNAQLEPLSLIGNPNEAVYRPAIEAQLVKKADNVFTYFPDTKRAMNAGLVKMEETVQRAVWTENARTLLLRAENQSLRDLVMKSVKNTTIGFMKSASSPELKMAVRVYKEYTQSHIRYLLAKWSFLGPSYAIFQGVENQMSADQFHQGLLANVKANIHNAAYENTMIYTPDKKLIYHVCVDKVTDNDKDSLTIYNDIGRAWNYRTVAIKKKAFQGNTKIKKIGFAENAVAGSDSYVSMRLAIPDSAFADCTSLTRFNLIYKTRKGGYRGLGPENFILGGDSIFAGCDSTRLQIVIEASRRQDFLDDENWVKYKRFFVYADVAEETEYTEYGVNYAYYYENNTTQRVSKVSGHKVEHLTAISADNSFLDRHQGSMGLFNDIGSYNNYKLQLVKPKAFAGNSHLQTVSFWDLNGGDAYTTLECTLGDSCFANCPNLKNIDMLYCVTDGDDHITALSPSQVRPGRGLFDGSPHCIIKMLPQQQAAFEADTAWAKYKDRFMACIIQPGDEGVVNALKKFRYYTPCCDPYYWDGYFDLARLSGANYAGFKEAIHDNRDDIRSFADFRQFEVVGLDYVGREWFRGLRKLTNIALPRTVKTIQDYAFASCSALQEIELPASVSTIGECGFADCGELKTIIVRGGVPATLGSNAFPKNQGMRIYVPHKDLATYLNRWSEYRDYILSDKDYNTNKVVTVKKAGTLASELGLFVEWSYSGAAAYDEPRYIHGPYAKYDSLTISGPLNDVDLFVIRYLAGNNGYNRGGLATDGKLRYLNLYDASIVKDNNSAHYINLSWGINFAWQCVGYNDELPPYLFYGCTALETVILPKSLYSISHATFNGCTSLKRVALTGNLQYYDGWKYATYLLDNPLDELVFYTDGIAQSSAKNPWNQTIGTVYTKASQIEYYLNHPYLSREAQFMASTFEEDAAMDALASKGLFFPGEYFQRENIDGIFAGNTSIRRFTDFSQFSRVRQLGDEAFRNCSKLKIISLTDSLKSISRYAFDGCTALDTIYVSCDSVPVLAENAFQSLPADFRIIVPKTLCKLYRSKWTQYADHISPDESDSAGDDLLVVTLDEPNTLAEKLGLTVEWDTHVPKVENNKVWFIKGVRGDYSNIRRLKVVGPISGSDLAVLRYLAGYTPWMDCRNYLSRLEYLDLYDADLKKSYHDGASDMYYSMIKGYGLAIVLKDNVLPTYSFLKCYALKTLILPRTCTKVETRAMQECENLEVLVIGDDMEDFNWSSLDDDASLTRFYILAKKKPKLSHDDWARRIFCGNYNPTFDAFYVRPSLYESYAYDDNYTGDSWQHTNNILTGLFTDDESFCAFASHAAATQDDLIRVTSVKDWFSRYPGITDLSPLGYTSIDSLHKATLAPLKNLEQIVMPPSLSGMEKGLFDQSRHLRSVDFVLCDSTDIVSGLTGGGLKSFGIDTQQTLVYVPSSYGTTDETNVVVGLSAGDSGFHAAAFRMPDTLSYFVPYAFQADRVENPRTLVASAIPYTVCVPYRLKVPSYARAYKLSDSDGKTLVFTEVEGELQPMQPYLLKVVGNRRFRIMSTTLDSDIQQTIPASGRATFGRQVDVPGFSVRGTLEAISNKDAAELGAYILQSDGDWHPVQSSTGATGTGAPSILPFRAYLLPSARPAYARLGMTLEDLNGIDTIETIDNDGTRRYYDLNGRELPGKPARGIYIHNGVKYNNKRNH